MNILIISDSYPPEIRSASRIMRDLALELSSRGYKIIVATRYPRSNVSTLVNINNYSPLTLEDGIRILRIHSMPIHNVNFIIRGISQLILPFQFLWQINKYVKNKIDILYLWSPPIPLAFLGKFLNIRGEYILNVQDIFPQNAIDLGIIKRPLFIRVFEYIEKVAYKSATRIIVHSPGNKSFLIKSKNVPPQKISIIPNMIDINFYKRKENHVQILRKNSFKDKFIFLYAGVFGPSQGLEIIIQAAVEFRNIKDICFILVGEGTQKSRLKNLVDFYCLNNLIIKPLVTEDLYVSILKEVNVGLVCLNSRNTTPVVPAKMMSYMAAKLPIAAFLNKESDGHNIIRKAKCGYSTCSDNPEQIKNIISKMYSERMLLDQLGKNGFDYVSKYYSKSVVVDKIEKLILQDK